MDTSTRRHLPRRKMESNIVESVGALVYCESTKRFLFLLRPSDRRHKKSWGLVGGKIETGETIQQGLVREIAEEIAFDSTSSPDNLQYVTNITTGTQYEWTGSTWIKSFQGLYPGGTWSLML